MSKTVPPEGSKDAQVAVVGEAPGKTELKKNRPFVGKSGKLLTGLMNSVGLNRSSCWITNVVKRKTPGNNTEKWRKQNPDEFDAHVRKLQEELESVNPNVVIPIGKTALRTLCGKTKVGNWRGSIIPSTLLQEQKCIPTYHPAAALRMYKWRYYIKFDLKRAKEESTTPAFPDLGYNYILEPSFDECMAYLNKVAVGDHHAFDIEVSGKEVSCISFASEGDRSAISIPFMKKTNRGLREYFSIEQEAQVWRKIGEILEDEGIKSIAHNAVFDTTFLNECYGIVPKSIHDTMVAQAILWPDFPKGLDFVTSIYTKIPYYKDGGKHAKALGRNYWRYNAKDSIVLTEAFPQMVDDLERTSNSQTYNHQRQLIEPACFMTRLGVDADVEGLQEWSKELGEEYEKLLDEIETYTGDYGRLNPNSPKQCMEYFYEFRGEKPYKYNGKPTSRDKAMKQLAGTKGYDEASLILEARGLRKMKGTYADIDLDDDGRMRGSINVVGTRFGRFSSSQTIHGTGGNMQNLPYGFREYLRPDSGYVGYEVDLGQAENRVVAYLGPDHNMIEAFESDQDIHLKTAGFVHEISYEEAIERHEKWKQAKENSDKQALLEAASPIGNGKRSVRYWGKRSNHAFNYAMGERKAARTLEIPPKEAKVLRNKYLKAYPGVEDFWQRVKDQLYENREVQNLLGRRYTFLDRLNRSTFKDAYAFIPQSTVVDHLNLTALREVYEDQTTYSEVELLNQVHDSIWFQIPRDLTWSEHAAILMKLCKSMESPLQCRGRKFSIPAEVEIAPNNFKKKYEIGEVTDHNIQWLSNQLQYHHERLSTNLEEARRQEG